MPRWNDDDKTPTPVTGVNLPTFPMHPMPPTRSGALHLPPPQEKTIPVSQIHIPLPAMIAVLTFMLGGVTSMTLVWAKASDPALHLEPVVVTHGGGVAYKNEVKTAREDFKDALLDEHRSTRRMLLQMVLRCKKPPGAGNADLDCKVSYLPESE